MQQPNVEMRKVYPGEVIFNEGSSSNRVMYVIKEGKVEISILRGNKKIVLSTLGRNQIFGEMALIVPDQRSATAVALTYCEFQVITSDVLDRTIDKAPPVVRHMLRTLITMIRKKDELIARQLHEPPVVPVYARLLDLLAEPAKKETGLRQGRAGEIVLPYGRVADKIQQILGHSRDQVMLILKEMARLNLLTLESGGQSQNQVRIAGKLVNVQPNAKPAYHNVRFNHEDMLARALQLPDEISNEILAHVKSELEIIGLDEFAAQVGVDRALLLRKLAQDDISDEVFAFRKSAGLRFVSTHGAAYFSKPSRKPVEDIDSLYDLESVSQRVLQDAVNRVEVYDLAKLVKMTPDSAIQEKLLSLVSKAKRAEIEDLLSEVRDDPAEAEEIEAALIATIKKMVQERRPPTAE